MADTHTYTVTIDGYDYPVESPTPLTEMQAYQAALAESKSNPPDYWARAINGLLKGATMAPINGVAALATLPVHVLMDAYSLLNGKTPEHTKAFVDSIVDAPAAFKDAGPEEKGRMVGDLLGTLATGAVVGKWGPSTAEAVARPVGTVFEQTGKMARWPMRISGSHAVLSGNPAGLAMVAAPTLLEKAGAALKRFGTEPTELGLPRLIKAGMDEAVPLVPLKSGRMSVKLTPNPKGEAAFQSALETGLPQDLKAAMPVAATPSGLKSVDQAIAERGREATSTRTIAQRVEAGATKAEQRADAEWYKQQRKNDPSAQYTPIERAILDRSTGGTTDVPMREGTISSSMAPDATSDAERLAQMKQFRVKPRGAATTEEEVIRRAATPADVGEGDRPIYNPEGSRDVNLYDTPRSPITGGTKSSADLLNEAIRHAAAKPENVARLAQLKADAAAMFDRARGGGEGTVLSPIEQTIQNRQPQVSVEGNVRPSRSRSGAPSATPGLTRADVEGIGLNPDLPIKKLTQQMIDQVLENRAQRSQSYRTDAGLDAGFKRASEE